jgi:hypothetical protein
MGAQQGTLELSTDGDTLTGTMSAGMMGSLDLLDGKVDGDNLSWNAKLTAPMPMDLAFTATVAGDTMTGEVGLGPMGSAKFEGKRA